MDVVVGNSVVELWLDRGRCKELRVGHLRLGERGLRHITHRVIDASYFDVISSPHIACDLEDRLGAVSSAWPLAS